MTEARDIVVADVSAEGDVGKWRVIARQDTASESPELGASSSAGVLVAVLLPVVLPSDGGGVDMDGDEIVTTGSVCCYPDLFPAAALLQCPCSILPPPLCRSEVLDLCAKSTTEFKSLALAASLASWCR